LNINGTDDFITVFNTARASTKKMFDGVGDWFKQFLP
jgi:hypothetical protein